MINKLINGDSIKEIKKIPDNFIHAIISDIPYGISYDEWDVLHKNTNSALGGQSLAQKQAGNIFKRRGKPLNGWSEADKKIPLEYQIWCSSWASEWFRVLKPGATCFIFAGRRYAHRCIIALEEAGFIFKDMIAWEKSNAIYRAQRVSAIYDRRNDTKNSKKWQGWRVANLAPLFEPILWFQKPYKIGGTLADNILENEVGAWNEEAISLYNIYDVKKSVNIIKVNTTKEDTGKHVTQKPIKLMEFLISLVTKENQIILDPFMGSGTTCVAAQKLNRYYIGIELDKDIYNEAKNRIQLPSQLNLLK